MSLDKHVADPTTTPARAGYKTTPRLLEGSFSDACTQPTIQLNKKVENCSVRCSTLHALRKIETDLLPSPIQPLTELSYGEPSTGNSLILGENVSVLRTLKKTLLGKIRCVYIDPPYNNKEQYNHYADSRSHDEWIEVITTQLKAIKSLLSKNGSIWISIDDSEVHYLKVAADQIFGRQNFVSTIVWQQRTTRENRKVFSNNHEYLLVYAKDALEFRKSRNLLPATSELLDRYKNPDSDPRGKWQSISATAQAGHATTTQFYDLKSPNGTIHRPPLGRCWVYTKEKMQKEIDAGNIWFGKDGNGAPRIKRFLSNSSVGLTPDTLWKAEDVGTNNDAKKQILELFPDEPVFDTPKPEPLIARILQIATNEGDLVLDAFLGSGTTSAVAHKMRRQYIGIEEGAQAISHCARRMQMVVNGELTGISTTVGWTGGGGFNFFQLTAKCKGSM